MVGPRVAEGLAGLECLSGIPGLAGATPIQNVGAYGQEVADTDRLGPRLGPRPRRASPTIPAADCGFGYRTSRFKHHGRHVVLARDVPAGPRARCRPRSATPTWPPSSASTPGDRVPLQEARTAVLKVRARKGMVLDAGDPDTRARARSSPTRS